MGPNPNTSVLKRRGKFEDRHGRRYSFVKTKVEFGLILLYTKGCLESPDFERSVLNTSEKCSSLEPSKHGSDFLASGTVRK